MATYFGDVQFVPGVGYMQAGPGARMVPRRSNLGDDGSVMMISGLGEGEAGASAPATATTPTAAPSQFDAFKVPVTLFGVTLPAGAWLLIAFALGGLAGFYAGRRLK